MQHELKCWTQYFEAVWDGRKRFESRSNDREPGFAVGDELWLREWEPSATTVYDQGRYTGRTINAKVEYLLTSRELGELAPPFVVMSITVTGKGWELDR